MFFDKELFVEVGKDPLFIRADEDLAALCGKLDDRINAPGIIYHPFLYRNEPTWYEKQIFVNEDGLLFSQGPKNTGQRGICCPTLSASGRPMIF